MFRKVAKLKVKCAFAAAAAAALAMPGAAVSQVSANAQDMEIYYGIRRSPIWFAAGTPTPAAMALPQILRRAQLDGIDEGPALAGEVELAIQTESRTPGSAMILDRTISKAWVRYVQAIEARMPGFEYPDARAAPRMESAPEILTRVAQKPQQQLEQVRRIASVNPMYDQLRTAIWNESQQSGSKPSPAELENLARIRMLAPLGKYLVVNVADAKLYMFEHGQQVDSMRVIAGKRETPTPLMVSMIYYATLNPYWNVPANLVQSLVAARVLSQGMSYLQVHNYQVVTKYSADAAEVPPASIDWSAVAGGKADVMVRQKPGPYNSMGKLKFGFANSHDIYLHDTPEKALFQDGGRLLSNGCIRLEDAPRLGRWLLGREPSTESTEPEQGLLLPQPVPIYITYLTLQVDGDRLASIPDPYGRDSVGDGATAIAR